MQHSASSGENPGHLFCFGLGYTAERLTHRLLADGWKVSGTARSEDKRAQLTALGVTAHRFDTDRPLEDPSAALAGVTHVIASIPPGEAGDPSLLAHEGDMRASETINWVGYLSTPAVYGDRQGGVAHEDDETNPGSARGHRRLAAERAWVAAFDDRPASVQVFRLAGIYGPGRNAIEQVRAGTARIIDKPGQVFNRIHVDDIGTILRASMDRPNHGRVYNVADQEACPSGDVIRHACALLGQEPPEPIPFDSADLSAMARSFYSECKRLDTRRLSDELDVALAYPTYREGLEKILLET